MAISVVAPYIGMTLLVIFGIIMWHLADDSDKKTDKKCRK